MPRYDGTGPMGCGPMTGRGVGPCGYGLKRNWGRGAEFGFRRFNAPQNQLSALEEEEKILKEELEAIKQEKASLKDQSK